MTKTLLYVSLILALHTLCALSQEILTGLEINQSVRESYKQLPSVKSDAIPMLEIPFFDDFSTSDVYPDSEKWSDRYAFINDDYPVNPVSVGVATLDAIDHTGSLYQHATTWPFPADKLTSHPLNLNYPESDSIYLSFFYQPQGKGDIPQPHDSLRLEFYSPLSDSWSVVWSVPGVSLHDFRLVMIPVRDNDYLQEGFRFRFSNIASIADNPFNPGARGNADHWNIDYVYLNKGRSYTDTVFRDVAFIKPLESLLNNYSSMPWDQFVAGRIAEMGSVLPVTYRNNDIVTRSVRRQFSIYDVYGNRTAHSFSGGTVNIEPGDVHQYESDVAYSFSSDNPDSALFRITAWLETDEFDYKGNDTVIFYQDFKNFYALDDGTAENGYGLFGGGAENASLAYRFRAYREDSLRAIQIYFNQSLNNASRQFFNLAVWDDKNGNPGNLIYSQEGVRPEYEGELNRFHTYQLDSAISVSQVFYVGLIQNNNQFLNIGFDVNRDNSNRIFYNIHGHWVNSSFEGSLMIRPVVGRTISPPLFNKPVKKRGLKVYPNPAVDLLYIDLETDVDPASVTYKLYNRHGQLVYNRSGLTRTIDLSSFPPGIYFLVTESRSIEFETKKILITN